MITAGELVEWLHTLNPDSGVYIDEGGLTLRTDADEEAYIEVGGNPTEDDGDGMCCMARHANAVAPWTCDCLCHKGEG